MNTPNLSIVQFSEWPVAAEELLVESEQEGFRFVRRAKEEWLAGANRFSKEGEALFGVFEGTQLMAIGGVNRESERGGAFAPDLRAARRKKAGDWRSVSAARARLCPPPLLERRVAVRHRGGGPILSRAGIPLHGFGP